MGLNVTHGAFDGSYSFFNDFRYAVAKRIGIDLNEYFGFNPMGAKMLTEINHPLRPLFDHSDCDGELNQSECALIAFGLDKVMNSITLDEMATNMKIGRREYRMQDLYEDCEKFRNGCLLAVRKKESLQFQ